MSIVRRVAIFTSPDDRPDPRLLTWSSNGVRGPSFAHVREERLKVPAVQLGEDVGRTLSGLLHLHIRWTRPEVYETLEPLASRAPPGLHVSYAPREETGTTARRICSIINQLFGSADCRFDESFTSLPSDKVSRAPAFQFYQPVERMPPPEDAFIEAMCGSSAPDDSCKPFFSSLGSAAYFDLVWDHAEGSLRLYGLWPRAPRALSERQYEDGTTEIGIMQLGDMPHMRPHEIAPEGLMHKFSVDGQPTVGIFAVPARHRSHQGSFSARFVSPGLHPVLGLKMNTRLPPPKHDHCRMYAYMTLPKGLFVDRYQLTDLPFLAAKNLARLHFASDPIDLEAPAYAVRAWGAAVAVELAPQHGKQWDGSWKAQIPLHLRYLRPTAGGYAELDVPYPLVFWACDMPGTAEPWTSPFDSNNLGYDTLFSGETSFWHLQPAPEDGRMFNRLSVPVADSEASSWVPTVTVLAVLAGLLWAVWSLASAYRTRLAGSGGDRLVRGERRDERGEAEARGEKSRGNEKGTRGDVEGSEEYGESDQASMAPDDEPEKGRKESSESESVEEPDQGEARE